MSSEPPSKNIDSCAAMVINWMLRGNIIRQWSHFPSCLNSGRPITNLKLRERRTLLSLGHTTNFMCSYQKLMYKTVVYSALKHWRQCACVHFLAAISDNKQELLDTVAKHRFV